MGRRRVGRGGARHSQGGPKRGLQTLLEAEAETEIQRLMGTKGVSALDFEAMETAVRRQVMKVAARLLERLLNTDTSDGDVRRLPCECGHQAKYAGRREKSFTTAVGELTISRAYFACERCHRGFFPRDRAYGLDCGSLSPAVVRMIGLTASLVSFEESSSLLEDLAGLRVSPKEVERTAKSLGEEMIRDEQENALAPEEEVPSTLYLGVDGTGVPMRREEVAERQGKQEDGSAKTREAKICLVWSAESRDKDNKPTRDEGSLTYTAAIETVAGRDAQVSPFAQRVLRETARRGFEVAKRQVVLGDGAIWIWNLADELFPEAIQILDRFHAKEHLAELRKTLFGPDHPDGRLWWTRCEDFLDAGNIDALLDQIAPFASNCPQAQRDLEYFRRNCLRMDYPRFEKLGLCTASGVVEAGCKTVVGTRLKRPGMHWTVNGANAIMALRCYRLSGRFEDFWERRADRAKRNVA